MSMHRREKTKQTNKTLNQPTKQKENENNAMKKGFTYN